MLHRICTPKTCAAIALAACAIIVTRPTPAHAQTRAERASSNASDDASTIAAARVLAVDGVKLALAGHCDEAIAKLERAVALHHAPIVVEQLGECYLEQGQIVAGTELLRSVLREPLPAAPSPALRNAHARAQRALDAAKPKIALLTIDVSPEAVAHALVTVDGQAVPAALIGAERPTDPGEHVIEVAAHGYRPERTVVVLREGETQRVAIRLDVDPRARDQARDQARDDKIETAKPALESADITYEEGSPRDATDRSMARPTSARSIAPNRTAAYVSWAVSAVALGFGVGFGIAAADAKSDLEARCPDGVCGADQANALESAKRDGTISTVAFSAGAVAAVVGTVLFLIAGGEERSNAEPKRVASGGPAIRF